MKLKEQFKSVDNEGLLNEMSILSKDIIQKLSSTTRSQQFVDLLMKILLFQDLLRLRILPDDYEMFLKEQAQYQEAYLRQQIVALFPQQKMDLLVGLNEMIKHADLFYKNADHRSEVIFNNSLTNMETEKKNISIIVSGGFHTNALVNLCKVNDISYLRVMPTVTNTESTVDYEGRMLDLKTELITEEGDI
ncbi:hypothetical protein ACFL3D_02785 [Candidatus Omnitrophota bacterium]